MTSTETLKPIGAEFWQSLFEEGKLSQNIAEMKNPEDKIVVQLPNYGNVVASIKRAAPVGANFMTDVYLLNVKLESGEAANVFVKVLPSNPASRTAAFIGKWYDREITIYKEWIPFLNDIASTEKAESVSISTPKCHYLKLSVKQDEEAYDSSTVVAIEELKSKGFSMVDSTVCHDLEHTQLVMTTYANYHALSIAGLRKTKQSNSNGVLPASLEVFNKNPYYVHPPIVYGSMVLPNYVKVLRHFGHESTAEWLEKLIPKLEKIWSWNDFIEAGPLTCVIHGDSWNNNFLFRYSISEKGNHPVDLMLVDWQIARCGHPSIDICFYLLCSTSSEFRKKHLTGLFSLYFTTLKANLKKIGIDLDAENYTEDRFIVETRQRLVLAMFMSFFILPLTLDSAKATKHAQDIKEKMRGADGQEVTELENFEETQKSSWDTLFQPDTIISNPVLSERLIELIEDVKELAIEAE